MFKKTTRSLVAVTMLCLSLAACGGTAEEGASPAPNNEATPPPKQAEPVKLVMLQDGATITDDEFKNLIAAPIHTKYPNITVEMRRNTTGDKGVQDLIAGGDFPDFIFTTYPRITLHRDLGTSYDLTELVKTHKMDLGKFDPAAMETSRVYGGGKDKLYAIPFSLNFFALFYNKDLFDTFGVTYPTDGMTWDDVYEMARKFTRVVDGVQYRGVVLPGLLDLSTQLTLPYVSQTTGKANVETDG
jgi:multiple sugar transport system substrate-binding protein